MNLKVKQGGVTLQKEKFTAVKCIGDAFIMHAVIQTSNQVIENFRKRDITVRAVIFIFKFFKMTFD